MLKRLFKLKQQVLLLTVIIFNPSIRADDALDLNTAVTNMRSAMADPSISITSGPNAQTFMDNTNNALNLIAKVAPSKTSTVITRFATAIGRAISAAEGRLVLDGSTTPLPANSFLAAVKSALQEANTNVMKYQSGGTMTLNSGTGTGTGTGSTATTSGGTTTTTTTTGGVTTTTTTAIPGVFVPLLKTVTDKYAELMRIQISGASRSDSEVKQDADLIVAAVAKEGLGVVERVEAVSLVTQINLIKNLTLLKGDSATRVESRNKLQAAADKFMYDQATATFPNISYADRILKYLSRVLTPADGVFSPGDGEARFKKVVDFLVQSQNFLRLSVEEKGALQYLVDQARLRTGYNQAATVQYLQNLLNTQDWTAEPTAGPTPVVGGGTPAPAPTSGSTSIPATAAEVETRLTALANNLVSLSNEVDYNKFLADWEAVAIGYNSLVGSGAIIKTPQPGQRPSELVAKIEEFAGNVVRNPRFEGVSQDGKIDFSAKVNDIYNIALGRLSIKQRVNQYSLDQALVNSDTKAAEFITRIRNDFFYDKDNAVRGDLQNMPNEDVVLLTGFLQKLKAVVFFASQNSTIHALQGLILKNLDFGQRMDFFSNDLKFVKSKAGATDFVDRFKRAFFYAEDGKTFQESFRNIQGNEKQALITFLQSLQANTLFKDLISQLESLIGIVRSGVGVALDIEKLTAALIDSRSTDYISNKTTLMAFLTAITALTQRVNQLRINDGVSAVEINSLITLLKRTQDSSSYWRLRSGTLEDEDKKTLGWTTTVNGAIVPVTLATAEILNNMVKSLQNPLPLAARAASLGEVLQKMKLKPDDVTEDLITTTYAKLEQLINDWQLATLLNVSEANASKNSINDLFATILGSPAVGAQPARREMNEFYSYRSNIDGFKNRVNSAITQEKKIEIIFAVIDNKVLGVPMTSASGPTPQDIEYAVAGIELLASATEVRLLTETQRYALRGKIDSAKTQTGKFSQASIGRLTAAANLIQAYEGGLTAPAPTSVTTTPTTPPPGNNTTITSGSTTTTNSSSTSTNTTTGNTTTTPAPTPAAGTVAAANTRSDLRMTRQVAPGARNSSVNPAPAVKRYGSGGARSSQPR